MNEVQIALLGGVFLGWLLTTIQTELLHPEPEYPSQDELYAKIKTDIDAAVAALHGETEAGPKRAPRIGSQDRGVTE